MVIIDQDERERARALLCAYALTAIAVMGAASVVPALPAMAAYFEISSSKTAWVIGFFIAPAMALTPVLGHISDRVGLKPTVLTVLVIYAACAVLCALSTSFNALIGLRFLQGVGAAALELLALVIIASVAGPDHMRKAMGRNASVIGICLCIYPVVSGFLVDWNWRAVFLMGTVAAPVAWMVYAWLSDGLVQSENNTKSVDLVALWRMVRLPEIRIQYILIVLLFVLLFGCFFSFVSEAAMNAGISDGRLIGTIPLAMAVAIALTAPMMDRIAVRFGERGVIMLAALFYAASMMGLLAASNLVQFLLASAVFGAGHGLLFPLTQSVLGRNAPSEGRGVFMSANAMAIATGQTIGPFIVGWIVFQFSLAAAFVFGAGVTAIILIFGWLGHRE